MIKLYSHNLKAYESAVEMLAETGKAAIIHPTGTGKSFIAFKLCEDHPNQRVLWLAPSEYIFKTQIENLKKVSGGYVPDNILFYTYAKLLYGGESEIADMKPDYIVLDEFHRCGAQMWGKGVQTVLDRYSTVPVLGLSATNIRYLDNRRDMAYELFDGNVASEMTLSEAIVRGILNPPKYVLSVFQYQKDLQKYERRVRHAKSKAVRDEAEKYLEALRRALGRAQGLPEIFSEHIDQRDGKYIVFCANVAHMEEMASHVHEWFGNIDDEPHLYKVYSDNPETDQTFIRFKKDDSGHLKLLFCIDMLNEGVHVEDVNGVILLRPTVSPTIYRQQIGRALSVSNETNAVIFDIVMNVENLYSVGAIQDEMQVVMTYYRAHGLENEIVNEQFQIVGEVRTCVRLFQKLNDTLAASWDYMYAEARKYYEQHGDLEVPKRYRTEEGYSLGNWLTTQRKVRRGEQFGVLGEDRIKKLDIIGMVWDSCRDLSWQRYYEAAKIYFAEHGDLLVPALYAKNGIKLGAWLSNLRTYRKNGVQSRYLTQERIRALESVGMVWDVLDTLWQRNYDSAKAYFERNKHLDVPIGFVDADGVKLGLWLNHIRNAYRGTGKGYRLTPEQIEDLNAIGMLWRPKFDRAWELGFDAAQKYFNECGHLNVPTMYRTGGGYALGKWIVRQRERKSKLSGERVNRLNAIGMLWDKPDSWEVRYALAKQYYEEHGDLSVPCKYVAGGVWLNKWLNEQKQIYCGKRRGKSLTQEQISRLNAIGMRWEDRIAPVRAQAWETHYAECREFYELFHHLDIPNGYRSQSGINLAVWSNRQRALYGEGKLTSEQAAKLAAIGMEGELADPWEEGYAHAREYFQNNGNLFVSVKYVCDDGYRLGHWIAAQRSNYNGKRGRIRAEQIRRLDSIGMLWNVLEYSWERAYRAAAQFFRQNGHIRVPKGTRLSGVDLHSWIAEQRRKYKMGVLPQEKILKLAAIGVIILPQAGVLANERKAESKV